MALSIKHPGAYVTQDIIELPPTIDIERFKLAWEAVVAANALLRTRLIETHNGMRQVVLRAESDWQTAPDLTTYLTHDTLLMDFGERLNRCGFVRDQAAGKQYFIWTVHHAM